MHWEWLPTPRIKKTNTHNFRLNQDRKRMEELLWGYNCKAWFWAVVDSIKILFWKLVFSWRNCFQNMIYSALWSSMHRRIMVFYGKVSNIWPLKIVFQRWMRIVVSDLILIEKVKGRYLRNKAEDYQTNFN